MVQSTTCTCTSLFMIIIHLNIKGISFEHISLSGCTSMVIGTSYEVLPICYILFQHYIFCLFVFECVQFEGVSAVKFVSRCGSMLCELVAVFLQDAKGVILLLTLI